MILNEIGDSIQIEHFENGKLDSYERRYDRNDQLAGGYKILHYSDTSTRYTTGYYWRGDIMISTYASANGDWAKETSFYKNKQKAVEITYNKQHEFNGSYTTGTEDGKLKEEKNYSNGKFDGEQRYWNDMGKVYQKDIYKNGALLKSEFVFSTPLIASVFLRNRIRKFSV